MFFKFCFEIIIIQSYNHSIREKISYTVLLLGLLDKPMNQRHPSWGFTVELTYLTLFNYFDIFHATIQGGVKKMKNQNNCSPSTCVQVTKKMEKACRHDQILFFLTKVLVDNLYFVD